MEIRQGCQVTFSNSYLWAPRRRKQSVWRQRAWAARPNCRTTGPHPRSEYLNQGKRKERETETGLLESITDAGVNYLCSEFTFPQTQQPPQAQMPKIEPGVSQTEKKQGCYRRRVSYNKVEDLALEYKSSQLRVCNFIFIQICSVFWEKMSKMPPVFIFFVKLKGGMIISVLNKQTSLIFSKFLALALAKVFCQHCVCMSCTSRGLLYETVITKCWWI